MKQISEFTRRFLRCKPMKAACKIFVGETSDGLVRKKKTFSVLNFSHLLRKREKSRSSELYGQVRSGFLFSSIKGKLYRIDSISGVFAKDTFFRFIVKNRVSRAAVNDVLSSFYLRSFVFRFFSFLPLAISPGFYRERRTKDRTLTRPRSKKEKNITISFAYCRVSSIIFHDDVGSRYKSDGLQH